MATSTVRLNTSVHSSVLATDPSGSGLKTNQRIINTFRHTTTTAAYATGVDAIATEIWNYINTTLQSNYPGASVNFVECDITIDNITTTEYSTPRYYSTSYATPSLATPTAYRSIASAVVVPSDFMTSFRFGPSDFNSQATLKADLLVELKKAVESTEYN